jgi:hypothetical protein
MRMRTGGIGVAIFQEDFNVMSTARDSLCDSLKIIKLEMLKSVAILVGGILPSSLVPEVGSGFSGSLSGRLTINFGTVGPNGTASFTKGLTLECDLAKVLRVKGKSTAGVVLANVNVGTLECQSCDDSNAKQ